jgi:hypothetical protein
VVLLKKRGAELPEALFACFWCGGTWLAYAATSRNYSGQCCSIRWFVPLLAPAYYLLGVFLQRFPAWRGDFILLSAWGAVLAGIAWVYGPWIAHMVPGFWAVQAAALVCWAGYRRWHRRRASPRVATRGLEVPVEHGTVRAA